jgi:hypothetical protein
MSTIVARGDIAKARILQPSDLPAENTSRKSGVGAFVTPPVSLCVSLTQQLDFLERLKFQGHQRCEFVLVFP